MHLRRLLQPSSESSSDVHTSGWRSSRSDWNDVSGHNFPHSFLFLLSSKILWPNKDLGQINFSVK